MTYAALLLMVASLVSAQTDYCRLSSCRGRPHVMCQYPYPGPARTCGAPVVRGVTRAEQAEILAAHNDIRQKVKAGEFVNYNLPQAASMPPLSWNSELATLAQRLADQCSFSHDQCRSTASGSAGQNIAQTKVWGDNTPHSWTTDAVKQWFYDELPDFRQPDLTFSDTTDRYSGRTTGHLTQVIWADTTEVGCGFTQDTQGEWTRRLYVCNYAPSGNIISRQIYQTPSSGYQAGAWEPNQYQAGAWEPNQYQAGAWGPWWQWGRK